MEPRHGEHEAFRQLIFPVVAGGQIYTVSVGKSAEETEHLLAWMLLITLGASVAAVILFLAGRLLLRRLWQPSITPSKASGNFNCPTAKLAFPRPMLPIDEFRNLETAAQMTGKILKDYDMLKNFADNASHEMQTPLAIINAKLDLMIQDQGLKENHHRQLQAMYDAVGRLSKLNQSLLLLTKIENNQFVRH